MTLKAVIAGSGIGGLATAIRLAAKGHAVEVFEKNSFPGGKLSAFEKEGYAFDAGPSLFTQPNNLKELFDLAGKSMDGYFKYRSVPVSNNYFFEGGKKVRAWASIDKFSEELENQLGEPAENLRSYIKDAADLYNGVGTIFLNDSLHRAGTWLSPRIIRAIKGLKLSYLSSTLHQYNSSRFNTPEAVQIFNRFATYNGSNPYQTPAMLSLIPHLEINEGTYYPEGGMISITGALFKLATDLGVKFNFNTSVEEILHENGKVKGIKAGGEKINSDAVISNIDVYYTYKKLLKDDKSASKVLKQERSSSAYIFYWGIRSNFAELDLHNIFFSKDYLKEFEGIFKTGQITDDPTVYINVTSKMESGLAPNGCENWFVMVNTPAHRGQNWEELRPVIKNAVTKKLSRMLGKNIEPLIQVEETLDPLTIQEKTSSYMGSLYGTSSNSKFAAFLRHPNFSRKINGLYFCGGSVHPGGGIPLCLKSAKIACEQIL
ncbi:MAG: 1-hydroxycarotenoid 3,4-desaturase CrtD [Cyclobacteriaceae bacterium]